MAWEEECKQIYSCKSDHWILVFIDKFNLIQHFSYHKDDSEFVKAKYAKWVVCHKKHVALPSLP